MKKRVILSVICFILVAFCMTAMITTPLKYADYIHNEEDIVGTLTSGEAISKTEGSLTFSTENNNTQYVAIKLKSIAPTAINIKLYLYDNINEDEKDRYNTTVPEGQQYAFLSISEEEYSSIKIDISHGAHMIDKVEFHSSAHQVETHSVYPSTARCIVAFLVSLIAAAAAFFADKYFNIADRIYRFITARIKTILKILISVIVALAACAVIELVISLIMRETSISGEIFNFQRYVYISAAALLVSLFVMGRNIIKTKVENIVLGIILILGFTMIFVTPPQHASWDIDSHYEWAVNASSLGKAYITQADVDFKYVYSETIPKRDRESNLFNIERLNQDYGYIVDVEYGELSIAHFPAGIAMAVTRFLHCPFYIIYKSGEAASLILYAFLCYLGLKKLKSGKIIFAVIALLPTNIFQASSYSYDYWVTAFALLGMAYFIGNCQRKEGYITTKDTIIMVAAFALACIPKQVYIMFMLIPFLMPKKKIENKKKYYLICLSGFVILVLSFVMRSMNSLGGTGDTRGGAVNPAEQMQLIFSNIPNYASIMFNFLSQYFSLSTISEYTTNFAYLGISSYGAGLITILLITVAVTDKAKCDEYVSKWHIRSYVILTFILTSVLMASAMYISYTPVGSSEIKGCQPRYLIPLLYPLLAVIGSSKIVNKMNRVYYNYATLGIMSAIVMYGIYDTMLFRVI